MVPGPEWSYRSDGNGLLGGTSVRRVLAFARSRIVQVGLVVGVVISVVLGLAAPAWPCTANAFGTTACSNTDHAVSWSLSNGPVGGTMVVGTIVVQHGTLFYTANGFAATVPPSGTTTATSVIPGYASNLTGMLMLSVWVRWPDDNFQTQIYAWVDLGPACPGSAPPTTTTTTTTTQPPCGVCSTTTTTIAAPGPTTTTTTTTPPTCGCTTTTYVTTTTTNYPHGTCHSVSAVSGNGRATVRWTPPAGGGPAITGYVVTLYAGWSPLPIAPRVFDATRTARVITGLKNGKTYRFKVAARYADGPGPTSASTNAIRVGSRLR
jgi:Fibronectin type III domain